MTSLTMPECYHATLCNSPLQPAQLRPPREISFNTQTQLVCHLYKHNLAFLGPNYGSPRFLRRARKLQKTDYDKEMIVMREAAVCI